MPLPSPPWSLCLCGILTLSLVVPLYFGVLPVLQSGAELGYLSFLSADSLILARVLRLELDKYPAKQLGNVLNKSTNSILNSTSLSLVLSSSSSLVRKSNIAQSPISLLSPPSSQSSKQPPQLSATILVLLTVGALVVFSVLAVLMYCCSRCRRRKGGRAETSAKGEKSAIATGGMKGIGREDLESGKAFGVGRGIGIASPSAFEFSPPSPTWRPTLPSMAYISSYSSDTYQNRNGLDLASGHGQILNAETIMREREPGRRKIYGGGGWSYGASGSPNYTSTAAAAMTMMAQTNASGARPHPYTQPQAFQGRVGIGIPAAPPLPMQAPQTYRPPAHRRPSRILRDPPITATEVQSWDKDQNRSWTDSTAPKADSRTKKVVEREREIAKGTSDSQRQLERMPSTGRVTVPRIKVHPVQDGPGSSQPTGSRISLQVEARTRVRGHESQFDPKKAGKKETGTGLQRILSLTSATQDTRLRSGLGISTINLNGSDTTPGYQTTVNLSSRSTKANHDLRPSSPATPSDEDVRLPYTVSINSVAPESVELAEKGGYSGREKSNENKKNVEAVGPGTVKTIHASSSASDKRKSRLLPLSAKGTNNNTPESTLKAQKATTRSTSLSRANSAKRQALTVSAVDQTTKCELHDMRSLGSESFDSLIAYLEESAEPADGACGHGDDGPEIGKDKRSSSTKGNKRKTMVPDASRLTREETARVNKDDYEAWVGSLDASPSVLRLAHPGAEAVTGSATVNGISTGARRRSRSASESGTKRHSKAYKQERQNEPNSKPMAPLRERDTNFDSTKGHARNKSVIGPDSVRNNAQGKVGTHVRALRARSASLKIRNQIQASEDSDAVLYPDQTYVSHEKTIAPQVARRDDTPQIATRVDQKQEWPEVQQVRARRLSATDKDALSSLPSFSIPSTATQLYAAFPAGELSSSASLSGSLTNALDEHTAPLGGTPATTPSKKRSRMLSSSGTSGVAAMSNLKSSSASASVSSSKAKSPAAYIARCAPTPHFKSAAVLSFLAPSPPSSSSPHSRSSPFRHRLAEQSRLRRISSSSMLSVSSMESAVSTWGRRSEWGRESLTPRFDHLRAVLEGSFEDPPPLPSPRPRRARMEI